MNYTLTRDGQQYGPYTLADLQRYTASGDVLLTDLAFSEGMNEPVPVSQVIGTIPVPLASTAGAVVSTVDIYPDPPNLHWGLVLLFGFITFGLFTSIWGLVLSAWLKKVSPDSRAFYYYIAALVILGLIFIASILSTLAREAATLSGLLQLGYYVVVLIARFSFRSSMEEHFNGPEPMGLSLSGVMTFFFGTIYFQYHVNHIVHRKNIERQELTTR